MSDPQKQTLFKDQLEYLKKRNATRPEFAYRLNRIGFSNSVRAPLALFFTGYFTGGWILKGFCAYTLFYLIFRKRPMTPYWNRQGYYDYDPAHHGYEADMEHPIRS